MKEVLLARMYALLAEQEGLYWGNQRSLNIHNNVAYNEEEFFRISDDLNEIAEELEELNKKEQIEKFPENLI